MNTNRLPKLIAVGVVLLLAISAGGYFLHRKAATSSQNEADINAIYQVVGEFGARLKDVPDSSEASLALLIKEKGVGVRVVAGKRVLHTADGRDLLITKGSDGTETVGVREYEAMYVQDELEVEYDIIRHEMSARTVAGVDSNLKRLITDRLYQEFTTYADVVPGKPVSGPYPESIEIDSLKKTDDTSYMVKGVMNMVMSDASSASVKVITLTVKSVNGIWLVDDIVVETFPTQQR